MLTIGLDLRPTESGFKAHAGRGTGRYAEELLRELAMQACSAELALRPIHSRDLLTTAWERAAAEWIPVGRRTIESQLLYPRRLSRLPVDAMHFFSHGDAPSRAALPCIVTVLDLIPLKFPELYRADKANWRFRFARYLEYQAIVNAAGILAISECTKYDIIDLLGVPDEKIIVTPLAVSQAFAELAPEAKAAEREEIRRKFAVPLERPMLLYVGGIDPRKNVPFLVDVLGNLHRELPEAERPVLCLAGNYANDDQYPALAQTIERSGLGSDVRLLGFVPDQVLPALYRAADLFVFPSLYEGFGFPVLESMACGTPVIAGNNSSIPEVAGSAAVLCTDRRQNEWAGAIKDLLGSAERRLALSAAGRKRASGFSWSLSAQKTIAAYYQFLGKTAAAANVLRTVHG